MSIFQLIGPFLLAQAVLLHMLERSRGNAVLRPRQSDYAVFATALGWLAAPMCAVTLVTGLLEGQRGASLLGVASLAAAAWWFTGRRERRPEPHEDDLPPADRGRVYKGRVRLADDAEVGGVRWRKGTQLGFDARGWIREAELPDTMVLGGHTLAGGQPVKFDEGGRIEEFVSEGDVVLGRLPRGPTEARGAELVARAGTTIDPRQLRHVVLARTTVIRGVEVPAGSVVSEFHGIRVELADETEVHGQRIDKGARLRFPPTGGLLAWLRRSPDVHVTLNSNDGYRTGGERRTIAVYADGRVE